RAAVVLCASSSVCPERPLLHSPSLHDALPIFPLCHPRATCCLAPSSTRPWTPPCWACSITARVPLRHAERTLLASSISGSPLVVLLEPTAAASPSVTIVRPVLWVTKKPHSRTR